MFPDIARDDVFRLETARLWLRWPRASDAAALQRYSSKWEVAQFTAHIPHPYPAGTAERFIFAARAANASGRDLTLVIAPQTVGQPIIGAISLQVRGADRLTLGYALAPEAWGRGYGAEAVEAMVTAAFMLTTTDEINVDVRSENPASRRVLEKNGFVHVSTGLQGAPARGAMVSCDRMRLVRPLWTEMREAQLDASRKLSGATS